MAFNTLVIITGYGSITPKPWKRVYLNLDEEKARQRFFKAFPTARDVSAVNVSFDDELIIDTRGDISSP